MKIEKNVFIADGGEGIQIAHDSLPEAGGIILVRGVIYRHGMGATLTRWARLKNRWRRLWVRSE